jgi:hypothetical protein
MDIDVDTKYLRHHIMRAICKNVVDTELVLKGETALYLCYDLNRYVDRIYFDSELKFVGMEKCVASAMKSCGISNYFCELWADYNYLQEYIIDYGARDNVGKYPLKINIVLRNIIHPKEIVTVDGIRTYFPSRLAKTACGSLVIRRRRKDISDVMFLMKNYPQAFTDNLLGELERVDIDNLLDAFDGLDEDGSNIILEFRSLLVNLIIYRYKLRQEQGKVNIFK